MPKEEGLVEPIKKYYIAYFDLLGYKCFFDFHSDKVETFLKNIHEAIQNTKEYIQEVCSSYIVGEFGQVFIQIKVFSDNILLCLETGTTSLEYSRFLTFMAIVADIQRNFILQYDLFLRGGITIGALSFNDDFVFGQGLIDAVALEEKAVYPRIIIGKTVIDYVLQVHFVKPEDLRRACEIENREHAVGEVSDEELEFCNSILLEINKEKFYLKWRDCLILKTADDAIVLNYLYRFDMDKVVDQIAMEQVLELVKTISPDDYQRLGQGSLNQKQLLEQHRTHIIQKINEYGIYDNLDVSAINEAKQREHILKKYIWVVSFHNYVCNIYNLPECMIEACSGCDIRFMRMTLRIIDQKVESR